MPTALPIPVRSLSWSDTVRFLVPLLRVRRLTRRVRAASRRVGRCGGEATGDDLLRAARAWPACYAAIADLLDVPEPPDLMEVRAALDRKGSVQNNIEVDQCTDNSTSL